LLKINGIISFAFQRAVQRRVVKIYSDLKAEALSSAIASVKVMKAQQVVKSESGKGYWSHSKTLLWKYQ
jgi:armadillo repeat-containing protein 1